MPSNASNSTARLSRTLLIFAIATESLGRFNFFTFLETERGDVVGAGGEIEGFFFSCADFEFFPSSDFEIAFLVARRPTDFLIILQFQKYFDSHLIATNNVITISLFCKKESH
jgi:hypothetical protein